MCDFDNNGYCGDCSFFIEENLEGRGICKRHDYGCWCYNDACLSFAAVEFKI